MICKFEHIYFFFWQMNIYTYIYRLLLFSSCLDLIKIGLSTFHTANLNWAYVLSQLLLVGTRGSMCFETYLTCGLGIGWVNLHGPITGRHMTKANATPTTPFLVSPSHQTQLNYTSLKLKLKIKIADSVFSFSSVVLFRCLRLLISEKRLPIRKVSLSIFSIRLFFIQKINK